MRLLFPAALLAATVESFTLSPLSKGTLMESRLEAVPTKSIFLDPETAKACVEESGTPTYVYSLDKLDEAANMCLSFPNAYGLTVRYAMKACPNSSILRFLSRKGIHIDASSGFEVHRAMAAGIPADHISLSTQELPHDFAEMHDKGVKINACSIDQLRRFGAHYAGKNAAIGLRINPGVGSGGFSKSTTQYSKTNVGGPSSSFGIWHELFSDGTVSSAVDQYGLTVERIHSHIGSGSDPDVWQKTAVKTLSFCKLFPSVTTCNLGGGYKVGRFEGEKTTDVLEIGKPVAEAFRDFAKETGREVRLEIEPGTYLTAMSGALLTTIQDKVATTGKDGHIFLKLDAGMTDLLRPSLYGALHPMTVLPKSGLSKDVGTEAESVVVVGHCCESGDLLTPEAGEPERLAERTMRKAEIGDLLVVDGAGAYVSAMSAKNYNSFPEAPELLVDKNGKVHTIRTRQTLQQVYENEVVVDV